MMLSENQKKELLTYCNRASFPRFVEAYARSAKRAQEARFNRETPSRVQAELIGAAKHLDGLSAEARLHIAMTLAEASDEGDPNDFDRVLDALKTKYSRSDERDPVRRLLKTFVHHVTERFSLKPSSYESGPLVKTVGIVIEAASLTNPKNQPYDARRIVREALNK